MPNSALNFAIFFLALLITSTYSACVKAASINTNIVLHDGRGGCSVSGNGSSLAIGSCTPLNEPRETAHNEAFAIAAIGSLGIAADASAAYTLENSNPGSSAYEYGSVRASFSDTIFLPISDGTFRLYWNIEGGITHELDGWVGNSSLYASGHVNGVELFDISSLWDGNGQFLVTNIDQPASIPTDIAFTGGKLNIDAFINSTYVCDGSYFVIGNTSCAINVAFGNTITVVGAALFDEDMNQIVTPNITSESGFDYIAGVTSVPVPAALPLLLSGICFIGFVGWRKRLQQRRFSY